MKTRQEIKWLAKTAMKEQWSTCILMMLLYCALVFVSGVILALLTPFDMSSSMLVYGLVYLLFSCVYAVLYLGVLGAYVPVYKRERVSATTPITIATLNFARKLGGMLWMGLWIFLWTLLLYIPGIIKSIAYSMTPFILSEHPNVSATEALKLSMRITEGHKGDLFVMYLSFIGWMLLSSLTFGILMFVYVGPYMYTTFGGYFVELRERALAEGRISAGELA